MGLILGGYLQYLNQQYYVDDIAEMENTGDIPIPDIEYMLNQHIPKAMEFEADYTSASMIASLPFLLVQHKRSFFQAYPENFFKKYDLRDAVFFCVLSLFHLFQEVRIKHNCPTGKIYPKAYYRFCSLVFGINAESHDNVSIWKGYNYQGVKSLLVCVCRNNIYRCFSI